MENAISAQLGIKNVKIFKSNVFDSDEGKLFLKFVDEEGAVGELESLKAIQATETIHCPKSFGVIKRSDSCALVTSYIDFHHEKDWAMAGFQLARMHNKNAEILNFNERRSRFLSCSSEESEEYKHTKEQEYVTFGTEMFGFHVPTCCGRLPQQNEWTDNWGEFFIRHRLKPQIDRLIEMYNDRQIAELADDLYRNSEKILKTRNNVRPALVHGDLWGGNWSMASTKNSENPSKLYPIIYDPSSSFSDPEFEFGIMKMFGGWTREFEHEYDKIIIKSEGREQRVMLYELYHHLNHWNHFGGSYKMSSMNLIRRIV